MRVASRRLRAALRVYSPCYPKALFEAHERAKFVTALLGFVRDLDVRMVHLSNIEDLVGPRGKKAAELMIFTTTIQWDQAREKMIGGLNIMKEGEWYEWMARTLSNPSTPKDRDWFPSVHALGTVSDNLTTVISTSHLARNEGAIAAQHELRIAIKKYRYSLDLLQFCFDSDIKKVIGRCKTLQDDLGLMHDYDVLNAHIQASRSKTLPKNIKKGMDEIRDTIGNLRHQQFELFLEHVDPLFETDPMEYRR
jgi:CHAD domain-containing protein